MLIRDIPIIFIIIVSLSKTYVQLLHLTWGCGLSHYFNGLVTNGAGSQDGGSKLTQHSARNGCEMPQDTRRKSCQAASETWDDQVILSYIS